MLVRTATELKSICSDLFVVLSDSKKEELSLVIIESDAFFLELQEPSFPIWMKVHSLLFDNWMVFLRGVNSLQLCHASLSADRSCLPNRNEIDDDTTCPLSLLVYYCKIFKNE